MTVIAAVKLHDPFAARKRAGQPNCRHRSLGSGIHEPNLLHRGNEFADEFGKFHLAFRWRAERRTDGENAFQRFENLGRTMPKQQRSPGTDIIDVFTAIDIPDARTFTAGNEERLATDRTKSAHRRIDTAGN